MNMIQVSNLTKEFEYYTKATGLMGSVRNLFHREKLCKQAVKNISFSVEEGKILGFLGPNGAGKTTTLKMLSGILYPSSGFASVAGYTPWERKNEFKKMFSIVMGQKNQLWWDLPASDSFYLNKCIYEIEDKEYRSIIDELSELLDVKDMLNIQVRRLSLGERMKMEIIAALIHRPKIIFLDEPTIGLDILSQQKIRSFLKYYNQQTKTTIILTSHYMKDIEELCQDVMIINHGQVVYQGELTKINDILGQKKLFRIQFSEEVLSDQLKKYGQIREFTGYQAVLEIEPDHQMDMIKELLNQFKIKDFNIMDIPIEEGVALFYQKEKEVSL